MVIVFVWKNCVKHESLQNNVTTAKIPTIFFLPRLRILNRKDVSPSEKELIFMALLAENTASIFFPLLSS